MRIILIFLFLNLNFGNLPFKLKDVKWLHTNVSKWPETGKLKKVAVDSKWIYIEYDKANVWPRHGAAGEQVVGNPWIFVKKDGQWYAATWEWLRPGQTKKYRYAVNGDHIKKPPLDKWSPVGGETYYFMISGLARFHERNAQERTNIVAFTWPGGSGGGSGGGGSDGGSDGGGSDGGGSDGGSDGGGSDGGSDGGGSDGGSNGGSGNNFTKDAMFFKPTKFVIWAFNEFLGRNPNPKEIKKYSGQLALKVISKPKLVKKLSKMANKKAGKNRIRLTIRSYYFRWLNRDADAKGLRSYARKVRDGEMDLKDVSDSIKNSEERKKMLWVRKMFRRHHDRRPSFQEQTDFVQGLLHGKRTQKQTRLAIELSN